MTRSRPVELEFTAPDDPALLAELDAIAEAGTGWVNIRPVVDEEHQPPPPGPFAFLGGSTHKVPTVTWLPGRIAPDGSRKPTTVGLLHAAGTRVALRLRELGLPVPDGWRITQDHPRRGLVALVPAEEEPAAVVGWLLRAAAAVCTVETTGRWSAAIHTGRP